MEGKIPKLRFRCGGRQNVSFVAPRAIVFATIENSLGGHHGFAGRFLRPLAILVLPRLQQAFDKETSRPLLSYLPANSASAFLAFPQRKKSAGVSVFRWMHTQDGAAARSESACDTGWPARFPALLARRHLTWRIESLSPCGHNLQAYAFHFFRCGCTSLATVLI